MHFVYSIAYADNIRSNDPPLPFSSFNYLVKIYLM